MKAWVAAALVAPLSLCAAFATAPAGGASGNYVLNGRLNAVQPGPIFRRGRGAAVMVRGGGNAGAGGAQAVPAAAGLVAPLPAAAAAAENTEGGGSSIMSSTFNMAKNIIGGGMLALPAGMAAGRGTGWAPAALITLLTCALSAYTFIILGKSISETGATNFKELWARTLGEKSAWMVDAVISVLCFGVCIMYGCFLGDLFSSLAGTVGSIPGFMATRTVSILGITGLVLFPLCLLRDLSLLSYSSMVGLLAVLYTVGFIVLRRFDGSYGLPAGRLLASLAPNVTPDLSGGSRWRLGLGTAVLFNMLSTSFMAHPNAVKFYRSLDKPTPKRFSKVVYGSFALSMAVFSTTQFLGHGTFGRNSQGLILNNYASGDKLAVLGRAATGVSIIAGQPLLFTGLRESVLSTLRSLDILKEGAEKKTLLWGGLTAGLLSAATMLAILTPDVGLVVSLIGSLLGGGIVYSLPALMYLQVVRQQKKAAKAKAGWGSGSAAAAAVAGGASRMEVLLLHLTAMFGVICAVGGTVITVLDTFTDKLV